MSDVKRVITCYFFAKNICCDFTAPDCVGVLHPQGLYADEKAHAGTLSCKGGVSNGPPRKTRSTAQCFELPLHLIKGNDMNNPTQSILLATLLAASGFASAQNPAVPATRAEVKSQINQDASAGNIRPDGPQLKNPAAGQTSDNTRADVKAQINTRAAAANTQAQGPSAKVPSTVGSENSRAGVKAEIGSKETPRVTQAQGPSAETNVTMTTAERKARRDERKAAAKAKRDAKRNSAATTTPASVTQKAP